MKIFRNTLYAIKPIWKTDRWYVIFNILYTFENIPRRLLNILIIKYIVDAASEGVPFKQILIYGIVFLAFEIVLIITKHCFLHMYKQPHEEIIRNSLRRQMMKKSLTFDLSCFDDAEFYDSCTKAFAALDNVAFTALNTLINLLSAIISVLTLVSYIFIIDPIIILVSLLGSAVSIFSNSLISKVSYSKNQKQILPSRQCSYAQDKFFNRGSAKDIRLEKLSELLNNLFDNAAKEKMDIITSHEKKTAWLKVLFDAPLDISDMFMWLYIAYGIIIGTLKVGDFMSLSNAVWSLSQQIRNVFNTIPQLYENSLYTNDIIAFDNYIPKIGSGEVDIQVSPNHTLEFKDVYFEYKDNCLILKGVSFSISTGQRLAIVGQNGEGKSTLIKLILRLYDPLSGCITLDNIPYSDYKLDQLRSQFAVVFQDYQYYAFTIAENVLMRYPKTPDEENEVIDALKKVGLYSKVSSFEKGIYTKLTKEFEKDGEEFSGGEYQKLAIARALVKKAPIVVMDEPSSALDPLVEKELSDLISEHFKDKIVIIISHKLSMTKDSDLIILLNGGIAEEKGSHYTLLNNKGMYSKLWEAQSQKYID